MKRTTTIVILAALLLFLAASCSRKGVHMSKHRKSRKCNCPTFVYTPVHNAADKSFLYEPGGER